MLPYNQEPAGQIIADNVPVNVFIRNNDQNTDIVTVDSFGEEWEKFESFSNEEINNAASQYFDIVSSDIINKNTIALDAGCGSGRWAKYLSGKVNFVEAIDPSKAIFYAARNNQKISNIRFTQANISNIPFADESFDFVFSLGVLHHIPDTNQALKSVLAKLKKGGWILLYLYYNLDNRGVLHKAIFSIVNVARKVISAMPRGLKFFVCDLIAAFVYIPLKYLSKLIKLFGGNFYKKIPLSYYHDKSFNIIRNDALDRFGTPLEQRFSRDQIKQMLEQNGLTNIVFSEHEPYWHVVAKK